MTIFAVVNNDFDENRILKEAPNGVYLSILNISYRKDKKKGKELMEHWGASQTPFILVNKGLKEQPIYKEASDDPIKLLKDYLNGKLL